MIRTRIEYTVIFNENKGFSGKFYGFVFIFRFNDFFGCLGGFGFFGFFSRSINRLLDDGRSFDRGFFRLDFAIAGDGFFTIEYPNLR